MLNPSFIHLRVHSAFSLLEGAIPVKDLLKWCVKQNMPAVALTDSGNLFASLEFSLAARDMGVQPIVGTILAIAPEGEEAKPGVRRPLDYMPLLIQNETGWQNLLKLSSKAFLDSADIAEPSISYDDLAAHHEGLIAFTGGAAGGVGRLLLANREAAAEALLQKLSALFGDRLYIELQRHGVADERKTEKSFVEWAIKYNLPLVATNDAFFMTEGMYEAHDALLCVAEGRYVSEADRRKLTPEHRLKTAEEMRVLFADLPEAVENTVLIAKRCAFMAPARAPILPSFTQGESSEADELRAQAQKGLEERLERHVYKPGMSDDEKTAIATPYRERLEFELQTIINMKFPGYFLIVSDFIKWSKAHDIPVGPGRGSGAGSLVAWVLYITDLDPLRYGLLFERFLNPQRVSMPDFDVDFCQDRREEVIAYVQQKYGRERVAQIITFGKLQARAVLRDVGRVLQMPYGQVDRICKLVPNNPANPVTLQEAIDMEPMLKAAISEDETVAKLVDIGLKLEGLNRHASTHAAGVVIADRPLEELVPLYRDPKSDMPVVQYSMKYAESAGLVKFDFLGLKTLTVLVTAVKLTAPKGVTIDLLQLPEGDKPSYELLGRGDTVGVFQLESAGMRDTLRKLKPDSLEDIIALVSLYRPGPMDNIPTYIARKHGDELPDYHHPLLEPILKETFGVIIYQEQVMQIAQVLAGYTLGEADLLRRAMGKKIRSEMEAQRGIFVEKAVERGVKQKDAGKIFDLIAKFAEYGFNKSHAAAYALVAYQTAYMKANYPVEFLAASMTYDMHNTDKLSIFREEAAKFNIKLLPPDVNKSDVTFSVDGDVIFYALAAIRNVGAQAMAALVAERKSGGPFKGIFDFASRVDAGVLNRRAMEHLIKAGAFDSIHPNRAQLMTSLDMILGYAQNLQRDRESQQVSLFGGGTSGMAEDYPPLLPVNDWPPLEKLSHEFDAIGFYLSSHPLERYAKLLKTQGIITSSSFAGKLSGEYKPLRVAGIVTGRKFKVSDKGRFAFIQLSDTGGVYEVSVFNETLLNQNRELLENGKVLMIQAEGKMDESGPRLIAQGICELEQEMARAQKRGGHAELRLEIDKKECLVGLKEQLGSISAQGIKVTLRAKLNHSQSADIVLPGRYIVTPATLDRIRMLPGIVAAEES